MLVILVTFCWLYAVPSYSGLPLIGAASSPVAALKLLFCLRGGLVSCDPLGSESPVLMSSWGGAVAFEVDCAGSDTFKCLPRAAALSRLDCCY